MTSPETLIGLFESPELKEPAKMVQESLKKSIESSIQFNKKDCHNRHRAKSHPDPLMASPFLFLSHQKAR